MIIIEAVIKPFKVDDVKDALEELGVGGMTITELMQTAPPKPRGRSFSSPRQSGDLTPKIKVTVAARSELAERILEAICLHGSSGKTEDGLVSAIRVESVVRIRTGEADEDALST